MPREKTFKTTLRALIKSVIAEELMKQDYGDNYSGPDSKFEQELEDVERELRTIVKAELNAASTAK